MIRPLRARIIGLAAAFAQRNAPPRLTSRTPAKSSSLIRINSVSLVMPALATNTLTWPSSWWMRSKAALTDWPSVTSIGTASAPAGASVPRREVAATRNPSCTSRRTMAAPIPRLPPVTTATPAAAAGPGCSAD